MNKYTLKFKNSKFENEYTESQIKTSKLFFFIYTLVIIFFGLTDAILSNDDRKIIALFYLSTSLISMIVFFIFNYSLSLDFLFIIADINFGIYSLRIS